MLFDTHVNLHAEAFADDLDGALSRARAAGVTRFLSICDKLESFAAIQTIVEANPDIWCSVGVHPHYAKSFLDTDGRRLIDAAAWGRVAGIGETGLDQHYGYSDLDDQVRSFRVHIEAARETQLPLIVHTREADDLTGDILEEEFARGAFPILLHCYTGGLRLAQRGLALGAYVSASGILSFPKAVTVREVIAQIPSDRLILETDCPYLAPIPHRGRRNEPAYLPAVCAALAKLLDIGADEMAAMTTRNALALFKRVT
jgi:TatD DNase family protein